MKLKWIRTKVAELTAEKSETEKGLDYHHDIEEFVVRAFELLQKAQDSEDASLFQWRGLKYDFKPERCGRVDETHLGRRNPHGYFENR